MSYLGLDEKTTQELFDFIKEHEKTTKNAVCEVSAGQQRREDTERHLGECKLVDIGCDSGPETKSKLDSVA